MENCAKELSPDEKNQVFQAMNDQNQISQLLSGKYDCRKLKDLPKCIQKPIKDIFSFAFDLLTDFEIRDRQYEIIYNAIPKHVCPFCGYEIFEAPGSPREALDHYLNESDYPFAASNLYNLAPMGDKCNSRYKLAADILWHDNGTRRKSFNPYQHDEVRISLDDSTPFATDKNDQMPEWKIDFIPTSEEAETWDEVFKIKSRYVESILNPSYKTWLEHFKAWFKSTGNTPPKTNEELFIFLEKHIEYLNTIESDGRDILKTSTFKMLYKHCKAGNERLILLLTDIITI